MKIAIVGNYGNRNAGDDAILSGLIHTMFTINKDIEITVFTNNKDNTDTVEGVVKESLIYKEKKSKLVNIIFSIKEILKLKQKFDIVILGGGGILMDMYPRDLPLYWFIVKNIVKRDGTLIVHGVGAGPLKTSLGKKIVKNILNSSKVISVRDEKSKKILNELISGNRSIEIIGDPAFGNEHLAISREAGVKKIGITVLPYFADYYWPEYDKEKFEQYKNNIIKLIHGLSENKNNQIYLYSTKYPDDHRLANEIYQETKKQNVILNEEILSPKSLIEFTQDLDVVVGTRLHSLIIGLLVNASIYGIGYHHKVEGFFGEMELENNFFKIDELNVDKLIEEINQSESNKNNIIKANSIYQSKFAKGVSILESVIEEKK
ncbi:polysaccharide pyruvyl transferase family protein [Metabacillus dongyingensis]|uniref:polysaccharide pyruvyl transferase family protein n=1 Tax=Metabacillus dongyingensis TaxID=2874282 RepID=UPI001CBFC2AD|nr:polysaccharide pyruvyl transferase family protein [Metabacillus dongyingensis]UAL52078.1 polysaccharide pyruvyl transferase family protein [Metabacillus dongyingensis]